MRTFDQNPALTTTTRTPSVPTIFGQEKKTTILQGFKTAGHMNSSNAQNRENLSAKIPHRSPSLTPNDRRNSMSIALCSKSFYDTPGNLRLRMAAVRIICRSLLPESEEKHRHPLLCPMVRTSVIPFSLDSS